MKLIYIALILLIASLWLTEATYSHCSKYSYRKCYYPNRWDNKYCRCCPYKCSYGYKLSGCKCIRSCTKRCSYGYYLDYKNCWCRRRQTSSCCKSRYSYGYSYCNRIYTKDTCNKYYKTKGCYWGCKY